MYSPKGARHFKGIHGKHNVNFQLGIGKPFWLLSETHQGGKVDEAHACPQTPWQRSQPCELLPWTCEHYIPDRCCHSSHALPVQCGAVQCVGREPDLHIRILPVPIDSGPGQGQGMCRSSMTFRIKPNKYFQKEMERCTVLRPGPIQCTRKGGGVPSGLLFGLSSHEQPPLVAREALRWLGDGGGGQSSPGPAPACGPVVQPSG